MKKKKYPSEYLDEIERMLADELELAEDKGLIGFGKEELFFDMFDALFDKFHLVIVDLDEMNRRLSSKIRGRALHRIAV